METKAFVLRANSGKFVDVFKKEGYVGIGWFQNDPFRDRWDLTNKEFLKTEYKKNNPDVDTRRVGIYVGQAYRFINDLKVGDIVICPYKDGFLLIGKIDGELYYSDDNTSPYLWRRKVKWLKDRIDRKIYSLPLWNTLRGSQTIFSVSRKEEVIASINN